MRARLAAAAAGALLIAAVIVGFALSSNPPVAATTGVEPVRPSVILDVGVQQCQALSRVPREPIGSAPGHVRDRGRPGPARRDLRSPRTHRGGCPRAPTSPGEGVIGLHPLTRAGHGAALCFSNPGEGQIMVGGDTKRVPGVAKGARLRSRGSQVSSSSGRDPRAGSPRPMRSPTATRTPRPASPAAGPSGWRSCSWSRRRLSRSGRSSCGQEGRADERSAAVGRPSSTRAGSCTAAGSPRTRRGRRSSSAAR